MKRNLFVIIVVCLYLPLKSQTVTDTSKTINLKEVVVTANRTPVLFQSNPGAISFVNQEIIKTMPKTIAAEEALRLVPGVRIDNQHNGERVHISIRGQGILTERGLRGIGVLIDGIPVNDPSGFAPDLYDVDWATVKHIEVLRGPSAGLYGGGGSAGVINISTDNGGSKPKGGTISQTMGSNGFMKSSGQVDGTYGNTDYRVTYSRLSGDGYRDHQAFWGHNLYEKINIRPTEKLTVSQIFSYTSYFHQNPEGLNLGQFDNLLQANPDACPFNEYQKTGRYTFGMRTLYKISDKQDVEATGYLRSWDYKETSNRAAEYRNIGNPGFTAQYNLHLGSEKFRNHLSIGTDNKWQTIGMYKLQSMSDPDRKESIDETNLENDSLLANQVLKQQSSGFFGLYRLEAGKFGFLANIRYDNMNNELTDKMMAPDTAKTSKNFAETSLRFGASYKISDVVTVYANFSQGFTPPSTEELASNPVAYHGFNTHLVPATSSCTEGGIRGFIGEKLFYDVTAFMMNTENDFFRFKQTGRGNQEVFYGNAGNSKRTGIELYFSVNILKNLNLKTAYTFADFKYTSAEVDPVYTDTAYVLTTPPASGQYLPNSPKHQLYAELTYNVIKGLKIGVSTEFQSEWAIYTDANAYSGKMDPAIYQNWQDGFYLIHARISYEWEMWNLKPEISFYARNITGEKYMAFTEPDPDGNSYQPGPSTELFGSLRIRF